MAESAEIQMCFSQVMGTLDDHVPEADLITCVEFNEDGSLFATGDKGGRVVIFQRDPSPGSREFTVYSTFQSHEAEFDYLKSQDIEEKVNKMKWVPRSSPTHLLLTTNDKTIKLWKMNERDKMAVGYNLIDEEGRLKDPASITSLRIPVVKTMPLVVEACLKKAFSSKHAYHINSLSMSSDHETFISADDLRINLWSLEVTDPCHNIVDIKPESMDELREVITSAECHPINCNHFVYSSSKGVIRMCDTREAALCDQHTKQFAELGDGSTKSFFSEIISSISDVKFSHCGRYLLSRDYLTVKVWDLQMESTPIETYQVHDYLRSKLCYLYENDYIFDKFECCWNGNDSAILTGSYNNFFRVFHRHTNNDYSFEASRDVVLPGTILRPRSVCTITSGKRKRGEVYVDSIDYKKKILHTAWHPKEFIVAVAATNNLIVMNGRSV